MSVRFYDDKHFYLTYLDGTEGEFLVDLVSMQGQWDRLDSDTRYEHGHAYGLHSANLANTAKQLHIESKGGQGEWGKYASAESAERSIRYNLRRLKEAGVLGIPPGIYWTEKEQERAKLLLEGSCFFG